MLYGTKWWAPKYKIDEELMERKFWDINEVKNRIRDKSIHELLTIWSIDNTEPRET